jgi:hypothetical protein
MCEEKSLVVGGITIKLKSNGKVYGSGVGSYSSTKDDTRIFFSPLKEIEMDMCIKNVELSSLPNSLVFTDTRCQGYDIFIYSSIIDKTVSAINSVNKYQWISVGVVLTLVSAYYLLK